MPVDGGANYYARFSHGLPASRSYFPIGVWGSYDHTQAHIDQDKAVGYNLYVWDADAPSAGESEQARGQQDEGAVHLRLV